MSPLALSEAKRRPERTARKPKRGGRAEADRHSRAAKDSEAVAIADRRDQSADDSEAARSALRDPYRLTGAELAAEIERALWTVPAARAIHSGGREASPEWEALATMVAERVYARHAKRPARMTAKRRRDWARTRGALGPVERLFAAPYGTPTADRRERLLAAEAERAERHGRRVPRGTVGREYLAGIAIGLLRDSREWRDAAESFTTRRQRQADSGPMVVAAEAVGVGTLARAVAARSARNGVPVATVPAGGADLAEALAERIAADRAPRERESITVALLGALTDAPLSAIAAERGYSIATAKRHSTAGAKLVTGAWVAGDIAAEVVEAARELRPTGREHSGPDLVAIGADTARSPVAALRAVEAAQDEAKRRASVGAHSATTTAARAARRNMRADRTAGRYGRSADRTAPEAVRVRAYPSAPLEPVPTTVPDRPTGQRPKRPAHGYVRPGAARRTATEAKRTAAHLAQLAERRSAWCYWER